MHWAFCYLDGFIYWSWGQLTIKYVNLEFGSKKEIELGLLIIADPGANLKQRSVLICWAPESILPSPGWEPSGTQRNQVLGPAVSQVLSRKTVRALRVNIFQPQLWVELQLYILDFLQHPTFFLNPKWSPLIRATTIVCFIISSSHKAYLDCHRAHCVSFLVLRIHFFKILARITL